MPEKDWKITSASRGAALAVQAKAMPGSNRLRKIGADGRLFIDLDCRNSPAEINQALVNFLSKILAVNPMQIEIVAGADSEKKLVSILDIDAETAQKQIMKHFHQR